MRCPKCSKAFQLKAKSSTKRRPSTSARKSAQARDASSVRKRSKARSAPAPEVEDDFMEDLDSFSSDDYADSIEDDYGDDYSSDGYDYGSEDYGSDDYASSYDDDEYGPAAGPTSSSGGDSDRPKKKKNKRKKKRKKNSDIMESAFGAFCMLSLGGSVGGVVGAGIWTAVTYSTGYEIGIIAWFVGICVGFGVLAAGGEGAGSFAGFIGAGLAILSVVVGKVAVVWLFFNHLFGGAFAVPDLENPAVMTGRIADQVVEEWTEEGKELKWPKWTKERAEQQKLDELEEMKKDPEELLEEEYVPSAEDYPIGVWEEAEKRWNSKTPEQQDEEKAAILAEYEEAKVVIGPIAVMFGVLFSFGFSDLLWIFLAAASAFRLSMGIMGDE